MKPHRWIPLLTSLIALTAFAGSALSLPSSIQILDSERVLQDRSRTLSDGKLYLEDQEGTLRRFVTSTSDPLVLNPGDGRFHPLPSRQVESALEGVDRRFLERLGFEIYILPYPVAEPMGSWAGEQTIYLSPGVYDLAVEQVQYLVEHEVGHMVHRAFLPDSDRDGWAEYCALRGIDDRETFNESAIHRNRPHEIFAEDFRFLFSSADGEPTPIENQELVPPDQVPGLREYFLGLIGEATQPQLVATVTARVYPNPLSAGDRLCFSLPGSGSNGSPEVRIYDLTGRELRSLRNLQAAGGGVYEMLWDGMDDAGRAIPRGAYFCKIRSGSTVETVTLQIIR